MNRVGSAVIQAVKSNRNFAFQVKLATQIGTLTSNLEKIKGVGAMTNKFTEMSGVPTLPKSNIKIASQPGNYPCQVTLLSDFFILKS